MQTLTEPRKRCKTCGAGGLEEDKVQQFFQYVDHEAIICLDEEGYRMCRVYGLNRQEVDRAVNILRARGLVRTTVSPFGIDIKVSKEGASCPAA